MRRKVAVSFEESGVKIVHASIRGQKLSVSKTEVIDDQEFESYLRLDGASEYIVTCEFSESSHGILTVPIVKPSLLKKIVESEIRKSRGKKDFSFVFSPLGERVIENRKVLEVFYYAVNNEEIRTIAERFYNAGKSVKAVYPAIFSAASMLGNQLSEEATMGVLGTGKMRVAFLIKKGVLFFIRNYELFEANLTDLDVQNINMTVSYCFQNIRISPSLIVTMGDLSASSDITKMTSAPMASLARPGNIDCSAETFNESFLPVASLSAPKSSNILSQEFKNIYALKSYLVYASWIFVLISILCLGLTYSEFREALSNKEAIRVARLGDADIGDIYGEFSSREKRMRQYRPVVEFLNRPGAHINDFLINLTELDLSGMKINSIKAISKHNNSFHIFINGDNSADSYSSMQKMFRQMIGTLEGMEGVKISDKAIDINEETFRIEMDYERQKNLL